MLSGLLAVAVATLLVLQVDGPWTHHAAASVPPFQRASGAPARLQLGVTTLALARNAARPWRSADLQEVNQFEQDARRHADIVMWFADWAHTADFDASQAAAIAARGSIPEVSWEPWDASAGANQPRYRLARIIAGDFDPYIQRWARSMAAYGQPVRLRFAHEMNGNWYPWSESKSRNRPGDYVRAWRHIHDVFARVGATNVIWVWSPNIIRPVPEVSLRALYPGDRYVDWAGMVGYGVHERKAAEVFDPTIAVLRAFTRKPLLVTETGSQPGPAKAAWTASLFPWLRQHRDVIGFIWFELSPAAGANADWRFTADPRTEKAFHDGIVQSNLARPTNYVGPGG
jgi:hypothetical protein